MRKTTSPRLVAHHDALGEGVEGPAEADGVGRGLGHRLGGPVGDLLEVVEGGLDPGGLVGGGVDAEAGGQGGQALLEGVAAGAPAEDRGHDDPDRPRRPRARRHPMITVFCETAVDATIGNSMAGTSARE